MLAGMNKSFARTRGVASDARGAGVRRNLSEVRSLVVTGDPTEAASLKLRRHCGANRGVRPPADVPGVALGWLPRWASQATRGAGSLPGVAGRVGVAP
jgi:hypothetical protein